MSCRDTKEEEEQEQKGDVRPPISKATMRRLETVLAHLNTGKGKDQKECHDSGAEDDSGKCSHQQRCMGDIEDLGKSQPGCSRDQRDACRTRRVSTSNSSSTPSKNGEFHQRQTVGQHKRISSTDVGDSSPSWLFNPERFIQTRKPLLEASTLPPEAYSSELWYKREMERVFVPSWTILGRVDEMREPGSYLAIDSEWGGPVAACRGEDGNIYAFANVCCHRGAKVVPGNKGRGSEIGLVCPYHAWTYDYNGKLKWAPGMDASHNFDEDQIRLTPVRVETFKGFVFVNVSDHDDGSVLSLRESLGDLPQQMPAWFGDGPGEGAADGMVCVARREFDVPCNWKFLMENTCETYHTSIVHKNSLGPMKAKPLGPHQGEWDAVLVPSERSIVPLPDDNFEKMLPTFTNKTAFVNIFPSLQINATWDCMWWMRLIPTSPTSTHILMGFCFPEESTHQYNFDHILQKYLRRWEMAVSEDNAISLNQQRGVRSKFRVPGRFSQLEFATHNMNNWLLSKMLDWSDHDNSHEWDPGKRVYVGAEGRMFSNADYIMKNAANNLAKQSSD